MTSVPSNRRIGVTYVESLSRAEMSQWLKAELFDEYHVLPGQAEDLPVQAIIDHYAYLTRASQANLIDVLNELLQDWRSHRLSWPVQSTRWLLNLIGELPAESAKRQLQSLALNEAADLQPTIRLAILQAIEFSSQNSDRVFWENILEQFPSDAGFGFQVLSRIAPEVALEKLEFLPDDAVTANAIAVELPDLLSQFKPNIQRQHLFRVVAALKKRPGEQSETILEALRMDGFDTSIQELIPERERSEVAQQQVESFQQSVKNFVGQSNSIASVSPVYATS